MDTTVARVLSQLSQLEAILQRQEEDVREQINELRAAPVGPRVVEAQALRQREQFLLGQVEGLIRAQLAAQRQRMGYAELHGMIRYPGRPKPADEPPRWTCAYCGLPIITVSALGVVHQGTRLVSCDATPGV